MRNKIENIRYSLLLGCYMMIMCAGFNYVTYYLLEKGISNKMVGVLIAGSCLLAVVLQQVLGRLVDKGKLEGKKALLLLALLQSVLGFCLVAFKATWAIFLMFGVILCSIQIMQPILNSFSFYYKNEGIGVNYGVARGARVCSRLRSRRVTKSASEPCRQVESEFLEE